LTKNAAQASQKESFTKETLYFIQGLNPKTKVIVRIDRFGLVIKPKIDPVEDLIGCVKSAPMDIEKQLDERVEEDEERI
jgi:hypothetical protein